ncbi:hypothetical protein LDENG_00060390 [Lucifuga dentata]|nr:hypothetical protein LDENG_00060390 [Lucifuga dentata]
MPVFAEDPAQLTKSRLKSDLIAHNVAMPSTKSKKKVYVELHLKQTDRKNAADFSSDEEDQSQDVAEKEEDPQMLDPSGLTDDDLKAALLKHGVKAGPIVASTRVLYEKKLKKLLQTDMQDRLNGAEEGAVYSDSEEEVENGEEEDKESGSEGAKDEMAAQLKQPQQENSQAPKESTTDTFKEMFPDIEATPTGIYATCRRPIKGAAGRPVQYKYPDSPVSPTNLETQEMEHRLTPVQVQIVVFVIVACLLYLIYVYVEDNSYSPFMALLESPNQGSDSEEGLFLRDETEDTPAFSGQE